MEYFAFRPAGLQRRRVFPKSPSSKLAGHLQNLGATYLGKYNMGNLDHEAAARIRRVRELLNGNTEYRTGLSDVPMMFRTDVAPPFLEEIDLWNGLYWVVGKPGHCSPSVFCMVPR